MLLYIEWLCMYHALASVFELKYVPNASSENVVGKLKNNLYRHGIPHTLVNDNGPHFSSAEFSKFVRNWQFNHETISPGTTLESQWRR